MKLLSYVPSLLFCIFLLFSSCTIAEFNQTDATVITTRRYASGTPLTITFERGKQWFHEQRIAIFKVMITPQIAVWTEDGDGQHLQTLYVTERFAKQDWAMAKYDDTTCIRKMSLPYWMNSYLKGGHPLPTRASPLPDGITGATPTGSFTLKTRLDRDTGTVVLYVELNKSFDTNDTYSKKRELSKFNGQPSVVYSVSIDLSSLDSPLQFTPVGHSGETGDDGELYPDIAALTTALQMVKRITVARGK